MGQFQRIYVVDQDDGRRAQIARISYDAGIHAEPSENLLEFANSARQNGIVLCADDDGSSLVAALQELSVASKLCLPTVAYSANPSPEKIVRATLAGALGYLAWPMDEASLRKACDLDPAFVYTTNLRSRQAEACTSVARLSQRERKVLQLMTLGHSNKEIGRLMEISPRTVEVHRANLYFKLNLRNSTDAVRIGIYAGLDEEDLAGS